MPREKVKSNGQGPESLAIHGRITNAARSFAQEILQILGSSTLDELRAVSQGEGLLSNEDRMAYSRTIELKRQGGTRQVECPVPDCKQPGVRAKMNFCHGHFRSMSQPDRVRFREAQRAAKLAKAEQEKMAAAGVPPRRS